MLFSTLPIVLAALPVALAASSTSSAAATVATSSSGKTVHVVAVGQSGLTFSPNAITAAVGDIVEFQFYPQAHSVAQSSFKAPCAPINDTAFFSGQIPSSSGMAAKTYQLEINSTSPIWFYCATGKHCESGMAGVINQASSGANTIEAYITAAKNISSTTVPSTVQGGVAGASLVTATNTTSSNGTATGSSATGSSTSAGIEARGSVRWGLVGFTGAIAVAVGSLMV